MSTLDAVENWEGISFLVAAGITWNLSLLWAVPKRNSSIFDQLYNIYVYA